MQPAARVLALLLAGLALIPLAAADVLCLKDGRILADWELEPAEGGFRLKLEAGEILVPAEMVLDAVIEGASTWVPQTDEEREKFEKGQVPFEGRWYSPKRRDQLIEKRVAERRAQAAELMELRHWRNAREETTRNFEFQYTVPPHIFEGYRDMMEAYFQAFKKDWKIKKPRELKYLKVCFYGDEKSFQRTGGAGWGVLGYFRFVAPLELAVYYDRLDPRRTEMVLFHEANHYLQKLIDVDFSFPHFPGEPMAEYYGASRWDPKRKKLEIGLLQEGRLTEVQTDIAAGEMMTLEKLILEDGAYEHYTWGWTLAHYLMNHKKLRKPFMKYFTGLAQDKGVRRERGFTNLKTVTPEENWRLFREYLGLETDGQVAAFEKDWHRYVQGLEIADAYGLEKAAFAASGTGRKIRAKRLYGEAVAAGSQNPVLYHRYAELLQSEGEGAEARRMWRRAIELDPLEPQFYAELGQALKRDSSTEAEGEKLIAIAKELGHDDPWMVIDLDDS